MALMAIFLQAAASEHIGELFKYSNPSYLLGTILLNCCKQHRLFVALRIVHERLEHLNCSIVSDSKASSSLLSFQNSDS